MRAIHSYDGGVAGTAARRGFFSRTVSMWLFSVLTATVEVSLVYLYSVHGVRVFS